MTTATPRTYRVSYCASDDEYERALAIRIAVFCAEQKFSLEDEYDPPVEVDKVTTDHLLMTCVHPDGTEEDAGVIRWWPKTPSTGKLGRLCVLQKFRGGGSGRNLVLALEDHLRQRKGHAGKAMQGQESVTIIVHSQAYAEGFYAKLGYQVEGEMFLEDGADHIKLVKTLQLDPEAK
ncbi:hypothetical protein JCM10207_007605 [Rhodosporidiobolus poonsookiae]